MKIQRLLRSLLFTFSVAFGLFATAATEAGSLSWVHVFPANDPNSGKALQGATPRALAKGTDGNFYGIADGGTNGEGIFFQITPAGTFTILLNSPSNIPLTAINSLVAVKNDASGRMVFYAPGVGYNQFLRIISDGTPANTSVEDILSLFNSSNIGTSIRGGLLYDGEDANGKSILYGTTYALGPNNKGSLFKIVTNNTNAGTSATVLHAFGSGDDNSQDDGFAPVVRPVKGSDGNLYGIVSDLPYAFDPPGTDSGKIYRYNLSTGTFHVLYTFPLNSASGLSELVESSSGIFFGVSKSPTGTNGGYIFKVAVSGPTAAVTVAHAFTVPGDESGRLIIDSDGLMYGAQPAGGAHQNGSIYDFTPDGTVTTLFEFSAGYPKNADGIEPQVYALDADGNIYGAAIVGGTNGNGTVFKLNAPPKPPLPSFTSFDAQQTSTDDGAPIHFTATMQSGVKITVQFSTNPSDPTSWSPLIDTGIMNEQPPGSGNYVLDSDAYPTGKVSFRAVATKPGSTRSLSDNKGPLDLHGKRGVLPTGFTVNESNSPQGGVVDNGLRFSAVQLGRPNGLTVRVQASTNGTDWDYLSDNNQGRMGYDPAVGKFLLTSSSYPLSAAVSFRAISTGSGVAPSISNVVGPFNLASNKTHIPPPVLYFTGNGHVADLYFRGVYPSDPGGVQVQVQVSTTPSDPTSWGLLDTSSLYFMTKSNDPRQYLLFANHVPEYQGIFFRTVTFNGDATAISGYSMPVGPLDITADTPPTVQVTPPNSQSGSGTVDDPFIVVAGTLLNFGAQAASPIGRQIAHTVSQLDGTNVGHSTTASLVGSFLAPVGDHVLQSFGIDDLGAFARAAAAIYIRAIPPQSASEANRINSLTGATVSAGKVFHVAQNGGTWEEEQTWADQNGAPGHPGVNDVVLLGSSTVNVFAPEDVGALTINGGKLGGSGLVTIHHQLTVTGATFQDNIQLLIFPGATAEFQNANNIEFHSAGSAYLSNSGTINVHGAKGILGIPQLINNGKINYLPPLLVASNAATDPAAPTRLLAPATATLSGGLISSAEHALISQDGSSLIGQDGSGLIGNAGGAVIGEHSSGVISNDGGTIVSHDGGSIIGEHSSGLISQDGSNVVSNDGGTVVSNDGGTVISNDGGTFVGTGNGLIQGTGVPGGKPAHVNVDGSSDFITQSSGEVDLSGVTVVGTVTMNGGILSGNGLVVGDLTNNGGFITPGHSAGSITVSGNFSQGVNGTLVIENGGWFPSQFDQLNVGGTANLGGTLDIKTIHGYTPGTQDTFSPLSFTSATGNFSSVSSDAQVTLGDNGLVASLDLNQPQPASGRPANISTRMKVLTDDRVLIGGFIVTGPNGSTKKVLVRGMGPTLGQYGVPGVLSDPLIELHYPDGTTVVTNDDWQQAANHDQIPQNFQPGAKESALLVDLAPGAYTVIEKGAHGETGVGLTEVYEFDGSGTVELANISTRGFIDTGDNVMIGGFIVSGSEPSEILVRGTGPSLSQYISGVLADPVLELHDANGNVIMNDDWRQTQEAEIQATTIPPHDDKEPAILATLVPGSYTAIVKGKDNTTGIGLVEAYKIK